MSNIIFTQCFVSETQLPRLIKWKTCPGSGESTHVHRGGALCGMRGMKLLPRLKVETVSSPKLLSLAANPTAPAYSHAHIKANYMLELYLSSQMCGKINMEHFIKARYSQKYDVDLQEERTCMISWVKCTVWILLSIIAVVCGGLLGLIKEKSLLGPL